MALAKEDGIRNTKQAGEMMAQASQLFSDLGTMHEYFAGPKLSYDDEAVDIPCMSFVSAQTNLSLLLEF